MPALNKIDLPAAEPDQRAKELADLLDRDPDDILRISAKTGEGVEELLEAVIDQVPPPVGDPDAPLRALIFDSMFDPYRGVIAYVRVKDGALPSPRAGSASWRPRVESEAEEAGRHGARGHARSTGSAPGEVGYLVTGLKDVHQAKVGDTITLAGKRGATEPLPGYREPKPMVWCGPVPGRGRRLLGAPRGARPAEALRLGAAVTSPRPSLALGFGFRCGFLGLLHMDIVKERLEREFDLELIATAPNVEFHVIRGDEMIVVHNPAEMPVPGTYDRGRGADRVRHGHHAERVPRARCSTSASRAAASWWT